MPLTSAASQRETTGLFRCPGETPPACTAPELTALLKRVDALDQVPQREALKVCLYLGGRRPTQLLKAQVTDIDIDAGSITIHDKKSRRRNGPRGHMVPLIEEASVILEARLAAIRDIVERRIAIGDYRQ